MTTADDLRFPAGLAAALAVPFHYDGGDGVDFEPFPHFLPADEATGWIRAWTGNEELADDGFQVFGQDGTGGYAAFWLIRQDRALAEQPVVFLGSEGGYCRRRTRPKRLPVAPGRRLRPARSDLLIC